MVPMFSVFQPTLVVSVPRDLNQDHVSLMQLAGLSAEAASAAALSALKSASAFRSRHEDNCRRKLGLAAWDREAQLLWDELLRLMND